VAGSFVGIEFANGLGNVFGAGFVNVITKTREILDNRHVP
jgi:hypothetical protein